jgi:hypothetical protein
MPAACAVKPAQYQRSIRRRLGLGVRIDYGPFNPPAVEGQVYIDALVFALEHVQVLAKKFGTFEHTLRT